MAIKKSLSIVGVQAVAVASAGSVSCYDAYENEGGIGFTSWQNLEEFIEVLRSAGEFAWPYCSREIQTEV